MKEIPILFNNKEDCCGCAACCTICPKQAIKMIEDEEGFLYPMIEATKCIRCYKCIQVCGFKSQE